MSEANRSFCESAEGAFLESPQHARDCDPTDDDIIYVSYPILGASRWNARTGVEDWSVTISGAVNPVQVNSKAYPQKGYVYKAFHGASNPNLVKLDASDGSTVASIQHAGNFSEPDLAVNGNGEIFVSSGVSGLQKFDSDLNFLISAIANASITNPTQQRTEIDGNGDVYTHSSPDSSFGAWHSYSKVDLVFTGNVISGVNSPEAQRIGATDVPALFVDIGYCHAHSMGATANRNRLYLYLINAEEVGGALTSSSGGATYCVDGQHIYYLDGATVTVDNRGPADITNVTSVALTTLFPALGVGASVIECPTFTPAGNLVFIGDDPLNTPRSWIGLCDKSLTLIAFNRVSPTGGHWVPSVAGYFVHPCADIGGRGKGNHTAPWS